MAAVLFKSCVSIYITRLLKASSLFRNVDSTDYKSHVRWILMQIISYRLASKVRISGLLLNTRVLHIDKTTCLNYSCIVLDYDKINVPLETSKYSLQYFVVLAENGPKLPEECCKTGKGKPAHVFDYLRNSGTGFWAKTFIQKADAQGLVA